MSSSSSIASRPSPSSPLPIASVIGDTSDWEQTAPDVDIDDDNDVDVGSGSGMTSSASTLALPGSSKSAPSSSSSAAAASSNHFATFVKESEEIELLLLRLPYSAASAPRLIAILDAYQEQCELLDPHLPHAVTTLMNFIHSIIRPGKVNPVPPSNSTTGAIVIGSTRVLAETFVAPACGPCSNVELMSRVFKVIYTLAKVRGYKTIIHFFPHEVADLEPALRLLKAQRQDEYDTWETRYGLFLWLSIIVLIPFDLTTVDSTLASGSGAGALGGSGAGIIASLISLGSAYMSDTGPPREAAAVMLSKLFSRADMHASHLASFFAWSSEQIDTVVFESANAQNAANPSHIFLITGILRALCQIFRHAPRDVLLAHVKLIYVPILQRHKTWMESANTLLRKLFVKLSQRVGLTYLPVRVAKWRYQRGHRSLLTTLQQSDAAAQAAGQLRAANPSLGSAVPAASAAAISSSSSAAPTAAIDPEDDDSDDVPSEIEDLVQILLDGLRDRDTVVRWSSAKGIGRLTNCLSANDGDDVVAGVLELFSGRESDGAWHGGCLALAELARRGLLLPERLEEVVPITLRALNYDQRTSTHSVGAHVRDASCYVLWAFARAYTPDVMAPYMHPLARGLITVCVFDREVNVRRASSAAFQEHVGRQGSSSFPHGMDILQVADYFTLSNRTHAYTAVAYEVAQYEEYTLYLIEHLLQWKVGHWEKDMRLIAARALGLLAKRNEIATTHSREVVVDKLCAIAVHSADLCEKHGALLSLGEIVLSLHALDPSNYLSVVQRVQICAVVTSFASAPGTPIAAQSPNAQLLNGRGGQIMREALCKLVGVISSIRLLLTTNPETRSLVRAMHNILDENLAHANEDVQLAAIAAVKVFIESHYTVGPDESASSKEVLEKGARAKQVIDHYVRTMAHASSLAAVTRGFAAALGTLPRSLLIVTTVPARGVYSAVPLSSSSSSSTLSPIALPPPSASIHQPLSRILQSLILSCTECAQGDAETRRNSVQSLVNLMATLSDEDVLQYITPMPLPPAAASSSIASSAAASSAPVSAARDKELKLAAKALKVSSESVSKYFTRDLAELGVPGNRIIDRVASALLIALDDYATDNRGDVGSWVREAAMLGLESILLKVARMQSERPTESIYPPILSQRVFTSLLKQAVEKIDRVRERAGQIFARLIWTDEIPHILCRAELRLRFPKPSQINAVAGMTVSTKVDNVVDWSSPGQTFPIIIPIMAISTNDADASSSSSSSSASYPYHRCILSGLLISVGGLSESVVKSSSESFISYVTALSSSISAEDDDAAHSLTMMKLIASDILAILLAEKGHARVIVPAFKTLELLLSQNLMEALTIDVCSFGPDLQSRVWKEVSTSTNIHKLMSSISVLVGLLSYPPPLRSTTFKCLLILLGHATFPKIRRMTGESLYNALLISDEWIVDEDAADQDAEQLRVAAVLDILTLTAWDGPVLPARVERDKLYALLKIDKPILKVTKKEATEAARVKLLQQQGDISALNTDYSSLVRNIGY